MLGKNLTLKTAKKFDLKESQMETKYFPSNKIITFRCYAQVTSVLWDAFFYLWKRNGVRV